MAAIIGIMVLFGIVFKIIIGIAFGYGWLYVQIQRLKTRSKRKQSQSWVASHRDDLINCKELNQFIEKNRAKLYSLWIGCPGHIYDYLEAMSDIEAAAKILEITDEMDRKLGLKLFPGMPPKTLYVWLEEEIPRVMLHNLQLSIDELEDAEDLFDFLEHAQGIFNTQRKHLKDQVAGMIAKKRFHFYDGQTGYDLQRWYQKWKNAG